MINISDEFERNPFTTISSIPINHSDPEAFATGKVNLTSRERANLASKLAEIDEKKRITVAFMQTHEDSRAHDYNALFCPVIKGVSPIELQNRSVKGYWVPYCHGKIKKLDDIGFATIPKKNPKYKFVFTVLMNGCGLIIAEDPSDNNNFRMYHFQNCRSNSDALPAQLGGDGGVDFGRIYLTWGPDEYAGNSSDLDVNGFNFLAYVGNKWLLMSQPLSVKINREARDVSLRQSYSFSKEKRKPKKVELTF